MDYQALVNEHGSFAAAARVLGIPASTLKHRARKAGVSSPHPRAPGAPAHNLNPSPPDVASLVPTRGYQQRAWGLGGPASLDLPPKPGGRYTVVGIGDLHGEWREQSLFEAQLRQIRDLQPDCVALVGDMLNFDIISRWQEKILRQMTPLQLHREIRAEINDFQRSILNPVREAAGNAIVFMVEGNHDDRLRKYLSHDLHEAWEVSREWLGVDDYLDGYYTRAGVFIRPEFLARHGDTTAQNPAKKELSLADCSGWSAHLHRWWQHAEPPNLLSGRNLTHTILPASCRRDANYGSGNAGLMRWHQGDVVGSFSADDPHDHVTDVCLWNGQHLICRGEAY